MMLYAHLCFQIWSYHVVPVLLNVHQDHADGVNLEQ